MPSIKRGKLKISSYFVSKKKEQPVIVIARHDSRPPANQVARTICNGTID